MFADELSPPAAPGGPAGPRGPPMERGRIDAGSLPEAGSTRSLPLCGTPVAPKPPTVPALRAKSARLTQPLAASPTGTTASTRATVAMTMAGEGRRWGYRHTSAAIPRHVIATVALVFAAAPVGQAANGWVKRALFARNAGAVDGFRASRAPHKGKLSSCRVSGKLPASILPAIGPRRGGPARCRRRRRIGRFGRGLEPGRGGHHRGRPDGRRDASRSRRGRTRSSPRPACTRPKTRPRRA